MRTYLNKLLLQSAAGDVCHGGHWANDILCLAATKTGKSTPGCIPPAGVPRARSANDPSGARVKSPHELRQASQLICNKIID